MTPIFWTEGGGERPGYTGILSLLLTLPLASLACWLHHRRLYKKASVRST